jgi:[acyl-carrier-protein] S-malonyltransferase
MGFGRLALERVVRLGVVFPGQGSQSVGMGGAIVERYPVAAELFRRAERVLGFDLHALIADGPESTLRETVYAQPAIYVTNYALAAAGGDLPVAASAGHSFGEYCSLTLAGALTFEVALGLVKERGLAMQAAAEIVPGAMAAIIGLDTARVRAATDGARSVGRVRLANFNGLGQIVISGDAAAVDRAGELAREAGAKRVVPLNVSGAWHSELMEPARARFAPFVERAAIAMPRFAVISNVDAQPYCDVETIRANLIRSVTDEVQWHAASKRLVAEGLDAIVEFGGSAVLASLLRRVTGAPSVTHVGDERALETLATTLASSASA